MADTGCRPSPLRRAEIQKTINPNQLNRAVAVINDQVLTALTHSGWSALSDSAVLWVVGHRVL